MITAKAMLMTLGVVSVARREYEKGSKMDKEFEVPEELRDIIEECTALGNLRDILVKLPFCFKKAKKCAIERVHLKDKFWREVCLLYPELKGKPLKYEDGFVGIIENPEPNEN